LMTSAVAILFSCSAWDKRGHSQFVNALDGLVPNSVEKTSII
jgi:hypothetical protein